MANFNHWYRWYFSAQDTIQMMRNGASLVQIYSSLVIEGPGLTKRLIEILQYLKANHYSHISEIID